MSPKRSSSSITVDYKSVHVFLKSFGTLDTPLPAPFLSLAQIRPYMPEGDPNTVDLKIAAQEAVKTAIGKLTQLNAFHADILIKHFVNPRPKKDKVKALAAELELTERQFWTEQKKAIETLAIIINQEEMKARQQLVTAAAVKLNAAGQQTLFGIDKTVESLVDALRQSDGPRIIVLTGLGGIGKTTLANQTIKSAVQHLLFHAVLNIFVPNGKMSAENMIAKIKDQLSETSTQTDHKPSFDLMSHLHTLPYLILIDGVEAQIDSIIEGIQPYTGITRFIVTSRPVPEFSSTLFIQAVNPLLERDGFQLFQHTSQSITPLISSTSTHIQAETFGQIFAKVGGNPLAIKLVAGLLYEMSLSDVLKELESVQHIDTEATFERIYEKVWQELHIKAKQILVCLGLFRQNRITRTTLLRLNNFPVAQGGHQPLAENDLIDILSSLAQRSLIEISRDTATEYRYGVHNLTRTYLNSSIIKWPEAFNDYPSSGTYSPLAFVDQGLVAWLAHAETLNDPQRPEADVLEDLNSISEIIDLGLHWAETRGSAVQLLQVIRGHLQRHGYFDTLETHLSKAAQFLEEDRAEPNILIRVKNRLAQIWRVQGRLEPAREIHQANLIQAIKIGNPQLVAETRFQLGEDLLAFSQWSEAIAMAKQAAEWFQNNTVADSDRWTAAAENTVGLAYLNQNRYKAAIPYFEKAAQTSQNPNNPIEKARYLSNIGRCHFHLQNYDRAEPYFEQAIELSDHNLLEKSTILMDLGLMKANRGEAYLGEARDLLGQANEIAIRLHRNPAFRAKLLHNSGFVHLRFGDLPNAIKELRQSVELYNTIGDEYEQALAMGLLAEAHLHNMTLEQAIAYYDDCISVLENYPSQAGLVTDLKDERQQAYGGLQKQTGQ